MAHQSQIPILNENEAPAGFVAVLKASAAPQRRQAGAAG